MQLFDTHAHLDSPQLGENLSSFLENAKNTGLIGIAAIGTNVASSQNCVKLADTHPIVHAAVGIHPNQCAAVNKTDWNQIVKLAKLESVVAIGETGLDRYWDNCPIEIQIEWFKRHIELSREIRKPVVVHMRDCERDILDTMRPYAQSSHCISGIMHSFAGNWETAAQCIDWGMHISFAGMVTFKNAANLREIAQRVPNDRLLVETDAPFLTPHPHRGKKPNHPGMVIHTAECIANLKKMSLDALAELTTRNALKIFGLPSLKK